MESMENIILIIYVISFILLFCSYLYKNIEPSIWAVVVLLIPIVNTYFAFKLFKWKWIKEFMRVNIKESYKQFIKDIEAEE